MLSKSDTWILYDGDGETTEFAYPFAVQDAGEVHVALVGETYKPIELTADFYVDIEKSVVLYPGYASGSEPDESEMPEVLASGSRILIYRATPCTQERELASNWPFSEIEAALDKQTAISQETLDILKRCLKIASTLHDAGIDVTVPWAADSSFKWNSDGSKLVLMMTVENALILVQQWLEELKTHLETMIKGLEAKLTDLINEVKEEIETLIAEVKAELTTLITELEEKHDADVASLNSDIADLQTQITNLEEAITGGGTNAVYYEITIPATGWTLGDDGYYYVDIALTKVTEQMIPIISIPVEYQELATEAHLKAVAETGDGYLRVYAETALEEEITAKLILVSITDTLVENLESQAKTEVDSALAELEEKHDADVESLTEQIEALSTEIETVAASISDTKVTNTLATTTKAYVTGTTSSTTNTGTQVFDTGVYLGTTAGSLYATSFVGDLTGTASVATKVGSSTVGSGTNPIYLASGAATASSSNVGSSAIPMYLASGVMKACGYNLSDMQSAIDALESNSSSITISDSEVSSTSGYIALSNGAIAQWGATSLSGTSLTVTFPTAFTSTTYFICIVGSNGTSLNGADTSGESGSSSASDGTQVYVSTRSTSNFKAKGTKNASFYWFAIGI